MAVEDFRGLPQGQTERSFIAGGSTGVIELLPSGYVRKSPYPGSEGRKRSLRDLEREFRIYQRLPISSRLVRMIGYSPENGIDLEYMPKGNLKDYLQLHATEITLEMRLQWSCDAAEALGLLHENSIIHGDLRPANILVDEKDRLRVIDFAGSSIDGASGSAFESARFCLSRPWDSPSTVQTDLFAMGSTIYAIFTGWEPYEDYTDDEVESLFRRKRFPPVDDILCEEVISKCWHGELASAKEAYKLIAAEVRKYKMSFIV